MCLPRLGLVIEVGAPEALVDVGGIRATINVMCVPDVAPGNHVMIHAGYALSILTHAQAAERQALQDAVRTGEPALRECRNTS